MNEPRWIRVTVIENLPPREGRAVVLGDREIALFNLGDRVLATDNQCPHKGGPLCDGIVTGQSVVCPLHAWKVNLASGVVERPTQGKEHCVTTYPTRIEDGMVLINLSRDEASASSPARSAGKPSPAQRAGEEAAA